MKAWSLVHCLTVFIVLIIAIVTFHNPFHFFRHLIRVVRALHARFDITVTVEGGGLTGQAGAVRHGLARALNHYNPDAYRPPLKRLGYLTRDPRKVERKKIGHIKARKKPQWVKR